MSFSISQAPADTVSWLPLLARIAVRLAQVKRSLGLIEGVFAELAEPFSLSAYLYYQADKDQGTLSLLAYQGIDETIAGQCDVLETGPVARESARFWPAEAERTASAALPEMSVALELAAGAHLPLCSPEGCLGSLVLAGRRGPFSEEEQVFLRAVADLVAAALERGRLRYQLQTEHARFQALLDHMPAAVLLAEAPSGRILLGNPEAERMLGHSLVSAGSESGVAPDPPELRLLRALSGEDARSIDYLYQRSDGTKTWLRASGSPIRDPQGRVIGSLITCYDIDERIRMQQELLKADRSKDQFLTSLGHELRNPLSVINYAVSLLEVEAQNPDSRQTLELMRRQLGHISRLIEDLLDLSRVKQGKIAIQKQAVDLNEVARRAVEATRPQFERREQVLEVSLAPAPLMLQADPVRLEQVVLNLLNNAAKYTESSGCIWLRTQREGDQACLVVRDNGIGISPEALPSIFELYTQDRSASDRSEGGLGVGLALVEALVKLHQGSVTAHSEGIGCGSQFTVRLPLCSAPDPPPQETA
jgi:PAS domain S-box-containing protein